jgi:hypothetical protein
MVRLGPDGRNPCFSTDLGLRVRHACPTPRLSFRVGSRARPRDPTSAFDATMHARQATASATEESSAQCLVARLLRHASDRPPQPDLLPRRDASPRPLVACPALRGIRNRDRTTAGPPSR